MSKSSQFQMVSYAMDKWPGGGFSGIVTESDKEVNRSKTEIAKWTRIIEKTQDAGIERLVRYIGSLTLGRDFGETVEAYFDRKGLTEFDRWVIERKAKQ